MRLVVHGVAGNPLNTFVLQVHGSALLAAIAEGLAVAPDASGPVIDALRHRDWEGDRELADLLDAAVSGRDTGRPAAPVDLDQLSSVLDGDLAMGFGGRLDLLEGCAWPQAVIDNGAAEDLPDPEDDPDRWLRVPNRGSDAAWRDMRDFAAQVDDRDLGDELLDAIEGRGAFSRFRAALADHTELVEDWRAFSNDRSLGRARAWLADAGYDARPRPDQQ